MDLSSVSTEQLKEELQNRRDNIIEELVKLGDYTDGDVTAYFERDGDLFINLDNEHDSLYIPHDSVKTLYNLLKKAADKGLI